MSEIGLPLLYALFLWWFATGAVLFVVRLPRRTFRWSMLAASAVLAGALWLIHDLRPSTTAAGAYLGFTAAILVWAWIELGFLTGYVTGSHAKACPPGTRGWERTRQAILAILHHEIALIALGAAIVLASAGGDNQIALWTYLILWVMRASSKLNLFFGVPVLNAEFLPTHLAHLASYFRQRPMNLLAPVSITLSSAATALLIAHALETGAGPHQVAGFALLAGLMALGVVEHWFMLIPLPLTSIWSWGLRGEATPPAAEAQPLAPVFKLVPRPAASIERRQP